MSPDINYEDGIDAREIKIRDLEQVDWVEWARAQALNQRVQIESHFTNRKDFHQREITEVDFKSADSRDKCVRQLTIAFSMMFDEEYVKEELVDKRGVVAELVDEARGSTTAGDQDG